MPQLDILIFFSQYYIFLLSFLLFYVFIIKYLVKEVDFIDQLSKYKMSLILNRAAIGKMIFDKNSRKTTNFLSNIISNIKNIKKHLIFEVIFEENSNKKYSLCYITKIKNKSKNIVLKFKNYIKK